MNDLSQDSGLLEAAKIHNEAVGIIQQAICEVAPICPVGGKQWATAILARLAHANLLVERYDPNGLALVQSPKDVDKDLLDLCRAMETYIGWSRNPRDTEGLSGIPESLIARFSAAIKKAGG